MAEAGSLSTPFTAAMVKSLHTTSDFRLQKSLKPALCLDHTRELHVAGQGGRGVHQGSTFGTGSGEGRSRGNVAQRSVRIHNHHAGQTVDVQVSLPVCAPLVQPTFPSSQCNVLQSGGHANDAHPISKARLTQSWHQWPHPSLLWSQ